MEKQALHVGTQIKTDLVTKLDTSQRPFRLTCDSGDVYPADARHPRHRRPSALARAAVRNEIPGRRRFGLCHL